MSKLSNEDLCGDIPIELFRYVEKSKHDAISRGIAIKKVMSNKAFENPDHISEQELYEYTGIKIDKDE